MTRLAVVTGTSRGLGAAVAAHLAEHGGTSWPAPAPPHPHATASGT
ncbi:hypothetical protein [Paractinoplanes deccanensis]|nr:hypothetical protein [Actinoplanes deccanensis]